MAAQINGLNQPLGVTTPFTTSRNMSIVNSHYSQYGHSVLTPPRYAHSQGLVPMKRENSSNMSTCGSVLSRSEGTSHSCWSEISEPHSVIERSPSPDVSLKRPKFNYRSLLIDNNVTKFLKKTLIDSDNFSLFSSKSSTPITVNQLPLEVLKLIFTYMDDHKTAVCCIYVNKTFYKGAKAVVYAEPRLTSTYRVAQFVNSLRENPVNGALVKVLDLSKLSSGLLINEEYIEEHREQFGDMNSIHSGLNNDNLYLDYALASWRDWKYKDDPLYGSSMLNSYNLSKTKSVISVNSMSTVTTFKLSFLQKLKLDFNDEMTLKLGKFRKKLFTFKRGQSVKKFKSEIQQGSGLQRGSSNLRPSANSVRFNFRDPKTQPFMEHHPYTNKFLLKYSSCKDIPLGYVLYMIELCPNITHLNISSLSISQDCRIQYRDHVKLHRPFSSLVEDVLPMQEESNEDKQSENDDPLRPMYLSDSHINVKNLSHNHEFVKMQDWEILVKISQLGNLQSLNLSSLSWINYKRLRQFKLASNAICEGVLTTIDLTNSGMHRGLRWAKEFDQVSFNEYFAYDAEPSEQSEQEDAGVLIARRIGMNY